MQKAVSVKKSVSLPQELWDFIESVKDTHGQGQASKVIHKALRTLRKSVRRSKGAK